jgi:hypothetical protein
VSISSTALSKGEKKIARIRSERNAAAPGQLLYSRAQARQMLGGISIATLQRLEARGLLKPVRLNRVSATAKVFYRTCDLEALAGGGDARS